MGRKSLSNIKYFIFLCLINAFGRTAKELLYSGVNLDAFNCHDSFCDLITCDDVVECANGYVVPRSSFCNCCSTCVKALDNYSSACQLLKATILENSKSREEYADEVWTPECNMDGTFKAKQTKKKKSFCVNPDNIRLFGEMESEASSNMTCNCSLHINRLKLANPLKFLTGPVEHCSPDGNFAPLQCIGDLCYCADSPSGDVISKIVKMEYKDKLECYRSDEPKDLYVKSCEEELIRTRKLRYQFHLKGINVIGLDKVSCDPDGSFSPKQCTSNRCTCTNQHGVGIGSYFIDTDHAEFAKLSEIMSCNCARDVEDELLYGQYPLIKCKGHGDYNPSQCFGDGCYCVDSDGDIISKQLNSTIANELFCISLRNNLYVKPTTTTTVDQFSSSVDDGTDDYDYD